MAPLPLDVGLTEAFSTLWPILATLGVGYLSLLGLIYKILTDQVSDLKAQNEKLTTAVTGFTTPIAAQADTAKDMNRTLEQLLDGILPRAPRGGAD